MYVDVEEYLGGKYVSNGIGPVYMYRSEKQAAQILRTVLYIFICITMPNIISYTKLLYI